MKRAERIISVLRKEIPDPRVALNFKNPLELLVATILSAQCTDERVNMVTAELFKKYRTAADYAKARPSTFEREIRSTGFYKSKARSVIGCCKAIVEQHGGKVPDSVDEMVKLPGVGRKTANVVLGNVFGQQAVAVDTHVRRVAPRLGLSRSSDPDEIEKDLMKALPRRLWTEASNLLIWHGRLTCMSRNPLCHRCAVYELCRWSEKGKQKRKWTGGRILAGPE
jgi:endonuclease-3